MQFETYSFIKHPERFYYEFESDGPNGKIKKVVEFYRVHELGHEVYNLAFGDWNEETRQMNDLSVSNNADRDKVLATVALTVMEFIRDHPNAIIFAVGSTASRTRLYQMGIAKIWMEIKAKFEIQGYINEEWQSFQKGVNYQSFLLKAK
jgi:hypothetical protein